MRKLLLWLLAGVAVAATIFIAVNQIAFNGGTFNGDTRDSQDAGAQDASSQETGSQDAGQASEAPLSLSPSESSPQMPAGEQTPADSQPSGDARPAADAVAPGPVSPAPVAPTEEAVEAIDAASGTAPGAASGAVDQPNAAPDAPVVPDTPDAVPVPDATPPVPEADRSETGTIASSFDVVRILPTGEATLAGQAPANWTVRVQQGAQVVGETTATPGGEWVLVTETPLSGGTSELFLQSVSPDGKLSEESAERIAVALPEGGVGDFFVGVIRPGAPTEILARTTVEAPATDLAQSAAAIEPREVPADQRDLSYLADGSRALVPDPEPVPAEEAPKAMPFVSIEAVESDSGELLMAGAADEGARLRVYADEVLLGEVEAGQGDRWLFTGADRIEPGDHRIRVDSVEPDSGKVLARVEVPYSRAAPPVVEPVPATIVPATAEAATTETATTEATAPVASAPEASAPEAAASGVSASIAPAASAVVPAPADPSRPAGQAASVSDMGQASSAMALAPAPAPAEAPAPDQTPTTMPSTTGPAASPQEQPARTAASSALDSPNRVIIRRGDNLWVLSRRLYGQGSRYSVIYDANSDQIRDPDLIYPGQVFNLPEAR